MMGSHFILFITENWSRQTGFVNRTYESRFSTSRNKGFESFVTNILPPPPDRRNVVLQQQVNTDRSNQHLVTNLHMKYDTNPSVMNTQRANDPQGGHADSTARTTVQQPLHQKLEISSANTTLIGDYVSAVFPEFQAKWLVQCQGNATFESTLKQIKEGLITVDRRYIFFQLGGNQIMSADANNVFTNLLNLVVTARECNEHCRIYFAGVLPRPIDNESAKPLIAKFNRWLANSVDRVNKLFDRIKFLPVQLSFLQGNIPKKEMFDQQNGCTLSAAGAQLFKAEMFRLAGFVQNK